jgi:hypothetical protein
LALEPDPVPELVEGLELLGEVDELPELFDPESDDPVPEPDPDDSEPVVLEESAAPPRLSVR